jgi:hypothetical protein
MGPPGQLHRHTQGRPQLGRHQRRGHLGPAGLGLRIPDRHRASLCQATMQGPAPSSAWTASARSAWASEALAQVSSSSLPTSMSPAPSAWNSSLAASSTCWRASGKSWLTSRVVRVPMLSAKAAVRCASPSPPTRVIPSHEGPRLAGSEGARPGPPARWQRWPDPSIAWLVVGGDAERGSVGARLAGKARGGGLGDDRQLAVVCQPIGRGGREP